MSRSVRGAHPSQRGLVLMTAWVEPKLRQAVRDAADEHPDLPLSAFVALCIGGALLRKELVDACMAAVSRWSARRQIAMWQEEVGELLAEINRYDRGRASVESVCEEVADVLIMTEQLRLIYGPAKVDEYVQHKLARLRSRLAEDAAMRDGGAA